MSFYVNEVEWEEKKEEFFKVLNVGESVYSDVSDWYLKDGICILSIMIFNDVEDNLSEDRIEVIEKKLDELEIVRGDNEEDLGELYELCFDENDEIILDEEGEYSYKLKEVE